MDGHRSGSWRRSWLSWSGSPIYCMTRLEAIFTKVRSSPSPSRWGGQPMVIPYGPRSAQRLATHSSPVSLYACQSSRGDRLIPIGTMDVHVIEARRPSPSATGICPEVVGRSRIRGHRRRDRSPACAMVRAARMSPGRDWRSSGGCGLSATRQEWAHPGRRPCASCPTRPTLRRSR